MGFLWFMYMLFLQWLIRENENVKKQVMWIPGGGQRWEGSILGIKKQVQRF